MPRKQYWPCNYVLFWTEICSRYLQKLHLPYKFSFANWPLSVFSVANSTWKIDRRFKQSHECESRFPGQPIFCRYFKPRASIILKSFRSFSDITEVKQNLRSIVTDFNFGAVKLPLNVPNIALFLILSLRHESRFAKALFSVNHCWSWLDLFG